MPGHYEDITNGNCTLTEASQVSEVGPGEGEQPVALSRSSGWVCQRALRVVAEELYDGR
jgi:hypothetical protein